MSDSSANTFRDDEDGESLSPEEAAAEERRHERARRDRKRSRIAVWSAFGSIVIIAIGVVGFGYWTTHNKPSYVVPKHVGANTDGIVAGGTGPVRVDVYVDYACVSCKAFAAATVTTLDQAIATNRITLVYHPLALHDAATSSQYSTRAAASAACASDMGSFLAYSNLLLSDEPLTLPATRTTAVPGPSRTTEKARVKPSHKPSHQPTPKKTNAPAPKPSPTPAAAQDGLSDDQLVQVGGAAGIINPHFAECLRSGQYEKWVANENTLARNAHITTTPTVLVNGASIAPAGSVPTLAELNAAIR
jgi:protein-disulfide isomerase